MENLRIDARSTALVVIDLQQGIVAREWAPYPASQVVANGRRLAEAFRARGGAVVYVRVLVNELLSLPADVPGRPANSPMLPESASQIVAEAGMREGDILVSKRQWGAFYGTDLDQQLRRRGIRRIAMAGIATNIGVESTARAAYDQGFELLFAEDAMASFSEEMHRFAIQHIFPRMGRVRSTEALIAALDNSGAHAS
jgi:nicotinamidase-related amidase